MLKCLCLATQRLDVRGSSKLKLALCQSKAVKFGKFTHAVSHGLFPVVEPRHHVAFVECASFAEGVDKRPMRISGMLRTRMIPKKEGDVLTIQSPEMGDRRMCDSAYQCDDPGPFLMTCTKSLDHSLVLFFQKNSPMRLSQISFLSSPIVLVPNTGRLDEIININTLSCGF